MISFIVPVYNGENFLFNNFECLLNQTSNKFEVIYVNDGSVDTTEQKLREICEKDHRFKFVSIENAGVMKARKLGLDIATFDFVSFLDVDDIIDNNFVSFFEKNINSQLDIYCTSFKKRTGKTEENINSLKPGFYNNYQFIEKLCTEGGWELCAKVFNKKLFDFVDYPKKTTIGEDALVLFQLVFFAKCVTVFDNHMYSYIYYPNSASNIRDIDKCRDGLISSIFIKKFLIQNKACSKSFTDSLILLFFSNSLRRGILKKNDILFKEVLSSYNLKSLINLSFKKRMIVTFGIFLTFLNFL